MKGTMNRTMNEPIYFVVERGAGGKEVASIYYDQLMPHLTRKSAKDPKGRQIEKPALIYALRLDRLEPSARDFWLSKSSTELLEVYHWLRDEGTLPPSNLAEPPKEKRDERRAFGEWWTQPEVPWDSKKPYDPNV